MTEPQYPQPLANAISDYEHDRIRRTEAAQFAVREYVREIFGDESADKGLEFHTLPKRSSMVYAISVALHSGARQRVRSVDSPDRISFQLWGAVGSADIWRLPADGTPKAKTQPPYPKKVRDIRRVAPAIAISGVSIAGETFHDLPLDNWEALAEGVSNRPELLKTIEAARERAEAARVQGLEGIA